jgi:hypothetical protein
MKESDGVGVLKIEESESEVLCTDARVLFSRQTVDWSARSQAFAAAWLIPSSGVKQSKYCLTPEYETDRLCRNVGNKEPTPRDIPEV